MKSRKYNVSAIVFYSVILLIVLYHQLSFAQQGCSIIATGSCGIQGCTDINVSSSTNETSRTHNAILQAAGLICSAINDSSCGYTDFFGPVCLDSYMHNSWSSSGCYSQITFGHLGASFEVCSNGTWSCANYNVFQGTWDVVCPPTLINLASFTATPKAGKVILQWNTESEIDNAGFNIYRSESEDGQYTKINTDLIPAKGASTQGASYEFIDNNVQNRKTYYYKLEDIDLNGTPTIHGPVSATPRLICGIR